MSKIPWKHFLPNFKCLPTIQTPAADDEASSKDQDQRSSSLIFNTLYHHDLNINTNSELELSSTSKSHLTAEAADNHLYSSSFSASDSSSDDIDSSSPPDFATILASQRFFFSSPGRSNSIVESPDSTRPTNINSNPNPLLSMSRSISVHKYSSNPYADFRHSMEEMLEARDRDMVVDTSDVSTQSDLEYLHELLLCYLSLNPKDIHKDIISAFTDLVICLLSSSHSSPPSTAATDLEICHHHQQQHHPHLLRQRKTKKLLTGV